ncbi:MAG TPA: NAD(P)/FAD-dependent oxidoreductase [Leptolyngbyaceae cyanobacterium M65_K2018_010]|nr:NAD(P)/FAD-dependent oxidoreductase [Leptolyngbyaceae cyanobacterium M65_K2018_010]
MGWDEAMTADYDGVIVGGTLQGREAAALAAREGARVALVEPDGAVEAILWRQLLVQVLSHWGQQIRPERLLGPGDDPEPRLDWAPLMAQVLRMAEMAYPHLGLESLAAKGVDVVVGPGQFSRKPRLVFATADRVLRARGFVLCPNTQVSVPSVPGLAETPYTTLDRLGQWTQPPEDLVILGRSPEAIALAQLLSWRGTRVTLVTRGDRLLPSEDGDISIFIESLLRAAGVDLRLGVTLKQVTYRHGFSLDLATGGPLQASHLWLATNRQPDVEGLNLEALGLPPPWPHLPVNDQLHTSHPRVFVCGPALGGYWAEATDHQDVAVALRNALYLPWRRMTRLGRLGYLATVPGFARLGLTGTQAERWYGSAALVLQIPFGETLAAHFKADTTGFCRWVLHRDGRLLGAQICGPHAEDLIQTVGLILAQNLPLQHIHRLPRLPQSHGEILHRMLDAWQHYRWRPGTWRRDWAENWFNWRRSRPFH